jgi:cobalt-precorrin 5A hydrolase / precorrin-3B C17-methyltransferase
MSLARPAGAAIVCLTPRAFRLGRKLSRKLPGAELHGLIGRAAPAEVPFRNTLAHLRRLFRQGRPIVGICASGILIRALAPLLRNKARECAVIAVAEDASAVVPLLGGHRGANALAGAIGRALKVKPAITTASEVSLGVALDSPPRGWKIGNSAAAKTVAAALLSGKPVGLVEESAKAAWLGAITAKTGRMAGPEIRITDRRGPFPANVLVLHPPVLAAGIGCVRGASAAAILSLLRRALREAGLAQAALACLVSIDIKMDEPGLAEAADKLGLALRFFPRERLAQVAPRLKRPSAVVQRAVGVPGVAEAAALLAVGPRGRLIVSKRKSRAATVAIAGSDRPIDSERVGSGRGRLWIVGLGPGGGQGLTGEARAALGSARDAVGYALYLELAGEAIAHCRKHPSPIGAEEARTRLALSLAAAGGDVALLASGDPGIFALASLAFELACAGAVPGTERIAIEVVPGVSAMQAAAARTGALLGHDFCAISLSDLLTPQKDIARRLEAAAAADFALALYNPASRARRDGLRTALKILRRHRAADTPVVLARNLARAGEQVTVTTLADLDPDAVDMLTILLVGNSRSRRMQQAGRDYAFTPRGYGVRRP